MIFIFLDVILEGSLKYYIVVLFRLCSIESYKIVQTHCILAHAHIHTHAKPHTYTHTIYVKHMN